MPGLSQRDVMVVVNRYIGVSGGYLGDFSYRTHAEFYPLYCDLDIDPDARDGTTRERFIEILSSLDPVAQSQVLRGVLARFPLEAANAPPTRTPELRQAVEQMAARLTDGPRIPAPRIGVTADAVHRALLDAERLVSTNGATSAVDRVHTALHAYVEALCDEGGVATTNNASLTSMFKLLRQHHPALKPAGPRSGDVDRILRAFASVLDSLNTLRNQASMAHPQAALLDPPEAMLVLHASRTVLHYLEARVRRANSPTSPSGGGA